MPSGTRRSHKAAGAIDPDTDRLGVGITVGCAERGELMHHELGLSSGDQASQQRFVVHIADDCDCTHMFEEQGTVRRASKRDDVVSVTNQQGHEHPTDRTRAAGDEDVHDPLQCGRADKRHYLTSVDARSLHAETSLR